MKGVLRWGSVLLLPVVVVGGLLLAARDRSQRNVEWPGEMATPVAFKSQSVARMLPGGTSDQSPPVGTIARGSVPFRYDTGDAEIARAGLELRDPEPMTPERVRRGAAVYAVYCQVCHGPKGLGDGPIIPKFPNPPSFRAERARTLADGSLYHIITLGRNNMPAHSGMVSPSDRWNLIHHIRSLQKEGRP
jgi:mono/diheme cytochrome c family protein